MDQTQLQAAPVIPFKSVNDTITFYFEKTNGKHNHQLMDTSRMADVFRHCINGNRQVTPNNHLRVLNWFKEKDIKP